MILPDRESEKPLLPLAHSPAASPPSSRGNSPPATYKLDRTLVEVARSWFTGKRRVTTLAFVAFLFVVAWGNAGGRDHGPRYHWAKFGGGGGPGGYWGPGPNAMDVQRMQNGGQMGGGHPPPPPGAGQEWNGNQEQGQGGQGAPPKPVVEEVYKPLTELGKEADDVYKVGDIDRGRYKAELEAFIRTHFPPRDWDEKDPHSLLNDMRRYFPEPAKRFNERLLPPIPEKLFQTAPTEDEHLKKQQETNSFTAWHPGLNITFHDDDVANSWVLQRFHMPDEEPFQPHVGIIEAWRRLASPAILRSDTWRYLILAVEGGVYADSDVSLIRPFWEWGDNPSWNGKRPVDYRPPSFIVGVEADVGSREDWHQWWPRPLQFSQWIIGSARGHPVMIDTLRRIVETALSPNFNRKDSNGHVMSVMERTGPGPFTDAVLRYVQSQWGKTWADLRGLGQDGWRYRGEKGGVWGDLKVLSITGFSPGVGHMGAEDITHPAAMAQHEFAGSWKGDGEDG
ncbi:hypothetical protein T439DRAFT_326636 [Meredithblackwellia eburnea MCA 4105]